MSSILTPIVHTYLAGAALEKGQAVKLSSGAVVKAAASTDRVIGIAQNTVTAAGDAVEVASIGGGAYAKAGGTIAEGDLLGVNTDGDLVKVANQHDIIIAQAMEGAVDNDIFSVNVVGPSMATQTQS